VNGRVRQVLLRFPAHLDAARPGKHLPAVVDALVQDLDRLAADLAAVRRSHRLADADTLADLLLLAGLHGLSRTDLDVLFAGAARKATLLAALQAAIGGPAAGRDAAAEALLDLWGIGGPRPRLPLFATTTGSGAPDLDAAARALAAAVQAGIGYLGTVEAARGQVARICQVHAAGNGTVRALLLAAANALDLEIDAARNAAARAALAAQSGTAGFDLAIGADADLGGGDAVFHSRDLFWHATFVRDRRPLLPGAPPAVEALGIEENPRRRDTRQNVECTDGQLFEVVRRGFGRELLEIEVAGLAKRTIGPMLVNRDEGHGVGFAGAVPAGGALVFREDGRALLDGADVTSFAYSWQGACFAGAAGPQGQPADPHDFVFDGPGVDPRGRAVFAVATPAGALDREFTFPHAGLAVAVPGIGIGVTRLAFFVQVAHLGAPGRAVAPRPRIAFADGSVFAASPQALPGSPYAARTAADLHLSWMEHEAYAVRVVIPRRFGLFDPAIADRVAAALARFRPAGVEVRVEIADDRWKLGDGVLIDALGVDPISLLQGGTVLSSSPPPSS
jgi:hypothetical protein